MSECNNNKEDMHTQANLNDKIIASSAHQQLLALLIDACYKTTFSPILWRLLCGSRLLFIPS